MILFLASTPGQGLVIPLLCVMVAVGAFVLSLLGRWFLPQVPRWNVYAFSPLVSAALLFGYYWVQSLRLAASQAPANAAYKESYARLAAGLDLNAWCIDLDPSHPVLRVAYTVRTKGTVAIAVIAGSRPDHPGAFPYDHYLGQSDLRLTQRNVSAGEAWKVDVPLERSSTGTPEAYVITFDFQSTDSSGAHVTTNYATFPVVFEAQRSLPLPPAHDLQSW